MTTPATRHLPLALLWLRLGVFIVMFVWTFDKFVRPEHVARIASVAFCLQRIAAKKSYRGR